MAVKTYALVYGGEVLAGVFGYANLAQATAELTDLSQVPVGQWMPPPMRDATKSGWLLPDNLDNTLANERCQVAEKVLGIRFRV